MKFTQYAVESKPKLEIPQLTQEPGLGKLNKIQLFQCDSPELLR